MIRSPIPWRKLPACVFPAIRKLEAYATGLAVVVAIWALAACEVAAAEPDNPNILFILADDMGYGDLGCYGAEKIKTPNIDRLAEEGILFTDGHCGASTCTPTRYGLLTGRHPWRSWLKYGALSTTAPLLIEDDRVNATTST